MNVETALQLAAGSAADISSEAAKAVVSDFFRRLANCPLCDGSGRFQYRNEIEVPVAEAHWISGSDRPSVVAAASEGMCPACGNIDELMHAAGDPRWVVWHCRQGESVYHCQNELKKPTSTGNHTTCGPHLVLPLGILEFGNSRG